MAGYRFYFLHVDGHIKRAEDHDLPSDDVAIAAAREEAMERAIEVWRGKRKVALIARGGTLIEVSGCDRT